MALIPNSFLPAGPPKRRRSSVALTLNCAFLLLAFALAITLGVLLVSTSHELQEARRTANLAVMDRNAFEAMTRTRTSRARVLSARFSGNGTAAQFAEIRAGMDERIARAMASFD